jgi:hypothetical protein
LDEAKQEALKLMGMQAGAITNMHLSAFNSIDLKGLFPKGAFRDQLSAKVPAGPSITSISLSNSLWRFGLLGENGDEGALVLNSAFHPVQAALNGKTVFPSAAAGDKPPP